MVSIAFRLKTLKSFAWFRSVEQEVTTEGDSMSWDKKRREGTFAR